jgi:hypothetical protein
MLTCLLCKTKGHHARAKKCPLHRDFVPPCLPKAAPVEARPLVEDARVVIPPVASCPSAQPACKGKGKGKATEKRRENIEALIDEAGDLMPAEVCRKSGDYSLLCFCCPMPTMEEFRDTYLGASYEEAMVWRSSLGKTMVDIHTEFSVRKAAGASAIQAGQTSHPGIFHSEEELNTIISWAINSSLGVSYGTSPDDNSHWLQNMPDNPEILLEADPIQSVGEELATWCTIRASDAKHPILIMAMEGGLRNLGWVPYNAFSALGDSTKPPLEKAEAPSSVTDNV